MFPVEVLRRELQLSEVRVDLNVLVSVVPYVLGKGRSLVDAASQYCRPLCDVMNHDILLRQLELSGVSFLLEINEGPEFSLLLIQFFEVPPRVLVDGFLDDEPVGQVLRRDRLEGQFGPVGGDGAERHLDLSVPQFFPEHQHNLRQSVAFQGLLLELLLHLGTCQ